MPPIRKGMMGKRTGVRRLPGVFTVFALAIFLLAGCKGKDSGSNWKNGTTRRWERFDFSTELVKIFYWNSTAGYLVPKWREIPHTESLTVKAELILNALREDPGGDAVSPVHSAIAVGTVYFDGVETIFIELPNGESGAGSGGETLAVKAICRSLKANLPEIGSVKFITEGKGMQKKPLHFLHECRDEYGG